MTEENRQRAVEELARTINDLRGMIAFGLAQSLYDAGYRFPPALINEITFLKSDITALMEANKNLQDLLVEANRGKK